MKKLISLFILFTFLLSTSANSAPPSQQSQKLIPEIPIKQYLKSFSKLEENYIGLDEFIKLRDENKNLIILDVRPKYSYNKEHIKGAINIDAANLTKDILTKNIPSKNSKIVVYCDNSLYPTRMIALTTPSYAELYNQGYKNIYVLRAHYKNGKMNSIEKLRSDLPLVK